MIGLLKIGQKNLFIRDNFGNINEIQPLCVLDFYVHENFQRNGFGKEMFENMITLEGTEPRLLGYDRPSSKFLKFLEKYYCLADYVPQNNNFVVYKSYFDKSSSKSKSNSVKNVINSNSASKENFKDKIYINNKSTYNSSERKVKAKVLTNEVNLLENDK